MAKPKIRFNGYTEDWEQRKLGDIADVTKLAGFEFTEHVVYSDEGNVIALRGLNIKNGQLILNDVKYIDGSNFSKLSRSKLFIDDIMFTYVGTVGEVAIIKENDRFYLAPNVSRIRVKSDDSPKFISHYMRTDNFKNKVIFPLIATSSQPALSMENIRKFTINIPINREEQDCLAKYFDSLDHLITLHQRKCEQTKTLKKYMLQKMFPQDGEKVPQIRFEGFTEDWEQRELSEIALQTYGGGTPKTANEEFWKGNIPWIQSSDLIEERLFNVKPRKYISQEAISKSSTKLVPQNSIAIVTRVGVGKLAFMPFSYATSQDFLSLSELKIEPKFAVYALYKMMRLVSNEVQGTSIKGITKDELLAKEILIPDCEEQKKIGAYLHNLDHLITLHQRKCDELKEVKKFMLQNMFV